jgi:hypothetical protein
MLRKLLVVLVSLLTTVGLMVPTATSASALGGEWLACQVFPGQGYYSDGCWGGSSTGPLIVVVMNETAPSTYSWAVPSVYVSKISDGCLSTTNYCQLTVGRGGKQIDMSVTLTQNGATETLTTSASIEPMCGTQWC